jgi:pimeloyl-ACP methyl ester carboxylesterase
MMIQSKARAPNTDAGFADVNGARLYYEVAGAGTPLVMIHAGVADHRQWNNEFPYFASRYHCLRYDLRGYGGSEPVDGEFSHVQDLLALLDTLGMRQPGVFVGCSMGGQIALDLAIAQSDRVIGLVLIGSGPRGLKLDVPNPPQAAEAAAAYEAGDLDRVAELETQIWFDGMGRSTEQVDPGMRRLAYEMNRRALALEARGLGKRLPDSAIPAADHLHELNLPALIIVGEHDTPFIRAAADYMLERLPAARKAVMQDAAHLANMDHPEEFRGLAEAFLDGLPDWHSAHPAPPPVSSAK